MSLRENCDDFIDAHSSFVWWSFCQVLVIFDILFVLQEEKLFKWDATTYPEVDEITLAIEPFMKLFSLVVKWQRAEKK